MLAVEPGQSGLGVPGRAEAEHAISQLVSEGQLGFVLAVVAKHVHRVYEQDGYAAGDRMLDDLALRLTGVSSHAPLVFRWSATSFVVLSRSLRVITDCAQIEGAYCALFGVWPKDAPGALYDRIDQYIATHLAYAA